MTRNKVVMRVWIPVDVEMPDPNRDVLVWDGDEVWLAYWRDDAWLVGYHNPGELTGITHWMPLPPGPEEQ